MTGHNPDDFDGDAPLPPELYDGRPLPTSGAQRLYDAAREHPGLPLRELAGQLGWGSSQTQFVGTPEQLADHVIASHDAEAVDGFTIMGSTLPYELRTFAEQVVPILQARGRFRTEYSGHTLRDHLGLDRPAGRHTPHQPPQSRGNPAPVP
jgi:N-acetyl-S-(2-succino)cysteine monooxygenase